MKECLIYTSTRSKSFVEKSRRLESRNTLLPVQYRHGYSEERGIVPLAEKRALRALQSELLKYSYGDSEYDLLKAAFSHMVPELKVYWDGAKLRRFQQRARELRGKELELLHFASSVYEEFVDERELPVLCRHHTMDFPQLQEWFLCDQRYIYDAEYDKVHIFAIFDEVALNPQLKKLLSQYPKAEFHLIVITQLDNNSYTRILSNYLGCKLDCKMYVEVTTE